MLLKFIQHQQEKPLECQQKIQTLLKQIGLKGEPEIRTLTPHEIDVTTAAMTAHLHLRGKTREVGEKEEGYIVIPKRNDWRRLNERT